MLAPGHGLEELAGALDPAGKLVERGSRRRRVRWLDTFDGRLHREGLVLEEALAPGGPRLRVLSAAGDRTLATQPGPAERFPRDLAPGRVRERIAELVGPRALLVQAEGEIVRHQIELRPRGRRPPVRLALERVFVAPPGGEPLAPCAPVLWAPRRRSFLLAGLLASRPGSVPARPDRLADALRPLGRAPRGCSGRIRVPLDPSSSAGDAARAILARLLGIMEANLPGLRDDVDPEFLHDFRVAVRRSRTAIAQLRGALPPGAAARARAELTWLQQASGPARDLDVYLDELPGLRSLLPPAMRRSLGPLRRLLERRRRQARAELLEALGSRRFDRFLLWWRAFLSRPAPRRSSSAPLSATPARDVAAARLRRLHRRALREGGAITPSSPPGDLHELRKTCKKLRYLLEFFRPLLDAAAVDRLVQALKGLQDLLGRHQDLQVQSAALAGFARELARGRGASPTSYLAMGVLVGRLGEAQADARRQFAVRFKEFSRKSNARLLKRMLAEPAGGGRVSSADAPGAARPH